MGVINGQAVNQTVTNAAFISKNTDDTMSNKLGFNRPGSGSSIADIQQATNNLYSCTGASESVSGTTYNSTPNTISNGDSHLVAFQKLAAKFDAATGHRHTGQPGDAPAVSAGGITNVPLLGYIESGSTISGATGSSTDVSSLLVGKVASTSSSVAGIPTSSPYNKVLLQYGSGSQKGQNIIDSTGNTVFGRLTFASSTWTLSYYSLQSGTENAYTFASSTDLQWYYQELFNPLGSPPNYAQETIIPGSNPTAAVLQAGSNVFGKVALSATAGADIASAGSIGTANGYVANSDHTHKGVHSVAATGNSAVYGDVTLSTGGSMALSQSGNTITISDTLSSSTPQDVASAGVIGTGTTVARADHVHKGLHSIAASGNSALYGDVILQAGANLSLTQTGQNILIALSGGAGTGTVTSVGLSLPGEFSVSGSPVTSSGTLSASWGNQNAWTYFGGPASGSAAVPNFKQFLSPTQTRLTSTGTTTGYLFTISTSSTCSVGDTYTNNGHTYTVLAALSAQSGQVLFMSGASAPTASGTLSRSTGSGTSSITFTANVALATYTPPAGTLRLEVRMIGGGGGGGGSVDTTGGSPGAAGDGTTTAFGALMLIANGGSKATTISGATTNGGTGGTASIFSPAYGTPIQGGQGQGGGQGTAQVYIMGGQGAGTPFAGGGAGGRGVAAGLDAIVNTGAGGGGAGTTGSNTSVSGSGGGAGGFIRAIVPSTLAASYVYCVGSGGSAGTGGASASNGGAGGSGLIEITEYYQ